MIGLNASGSGSPPPGRPKTSQKLASDDEESECSSILDDKSSKTITAASRSSCYSDAISEESVPFTIINGSSETESLGRVRTTLSKPILRRRNMIKKEDAVIDEPDPKQKKPKRKSVRLVQLAIATIGTIFIIHMMCIAVAFFQISRISPTKLRIRSIRIDGLDSETGRLSAEVSFPIPFLARAFTAQLKDGLIRVQDNHNKEDEELLKISLPDIVVGRGTRNVFRLEEIKFQSNLTCSLLGRLLDHVKDPTLDDTFLVQFQGRAKTRSFWWPINTLVNYHQTISVHQLKKIFSTADMKPSSSTIPGMPLFKPTSIEFGSADDAGISVRLTMRIPQQFIPRFFELSVPGLTVFISCSPTAVDLVAPEFVTFGEAKVMPFQLSGNPLERSNEISMEVRIIEGSQQALRWISSALRDQTFDVTFRLHLPSDKSILSRLSSFDFKLDLKEAADLLQLRNIRAERDDLRSVGVMQAMRLIKRHFSSEDSFDSLAIQPPSFLSSYVTQHQHQEPILDVDWNQFEVKNGRASITVALKLRRDLLSHLTGGKLDFRLISGLLPILRTRIRTEYLQDEGVRVVDFGQVSIGFRPWEKGSAHFSCMIQATVELPTIHALLRQGHAPALIFGSAGDGLLDSILDEWEASVKFGRSSISVFFSQMKTRHELFHFDLEGSQEPFEKLRGYRVQKGNVTIKTDDEMLKLVASFITDKKSAYENLPFVRISWPELNLFFNPSFRSPRLMKKFSNTRLADVYIPKSSMSFALGSSHPLNLIFDGAVQIQLIFKDRLKSAKLTNLLRYFFQGRMRRSPFRTIKLCQEDESLVRIPVGWIINQIQMVASTMNGPDKDFIRMDESAQIAVVGMNNAKVSLKVPLPQTKRLAMPRDIRENIFMISIVCPPVEALVCASKKDGTRWCPFSAGIEPVMIDMILKHGYPVAIRANHHERIEYDRKLHSVVFGFVEIKSFTEMAGFLETVLFSTDPNNHRFTFGDSYRLEMTGSLLNRLSNIVGSNVQVPMPMLPSSWSLFGKQSRSRGRHRIRYKRNECIKVDASLTSPSPNLLSFNFSLIIPKSCIRGTRGDRKAPDLFLIKWGDVKMKLSSNRMGQLVVSMKGGEVGINLTEMTKPRPKSIILSRSRLFKFHLDFITVTGVTSANIRKVMMATLYNLDWGVGHIFPLFKSRRDCFRHRQCRKLVADSELFDLGFGELLKTEFQMDLEHESINSFFGSNQQTKVLYLKRGLDLMKKLWRRFGSQILESFNIFKSIDIEKYFGADIELLYHPKTREGRLVGIPALLPAFAFPEELGVVIERQFAAAEIRLHKTFDYLGRLISRAFRKIYYLLDFPAFPMMLLYSFSCPEILLGVGFNRIDLVEVRLLPIVVKRRVNLKNPEWKRQQSLRPFYAVIDFPKVMHEVPGFFSVFGLDPYFQIDTEEPPVVWFKGRRKLETYNSPLNSSLETCRIHTKPPNLLSILIASAPEIPIFPVTSRVKPFNYSLALTRTRKHEIELAFGGLRVYNPIPGTTLHLGELEVVASYKKVPFIKMFFGRTRLIFGSTYLRSKIIFSKTGFNMKHPRGKEGIWEALQSLIKLGAAGDPLKLDLLIKINESLLIRMPFRVPKRTFPAISEILSMQPSVGSDVMDAAWDAGLAIAKDLKEDVLGSAMKVGEDLKTRANSYIKSWFYWYEGNEEPSDSGSGHGDAGREDLRRRTDEPEVRFRKESAKSYLAFNLPSPFNFDTELLSYKLQVSFDRASQDCPTTIPLADYLLSSDPVLQVTSDEGGVMIFGPGRPLILKRGLLGGKDLPSAKFALAAASNLYKRSGMCAKVIVEAEIGIQVPKQEAFRLPVKLSFDKVPIKRYPELDICDTSEDCHPKIEVIREGDIDEEIELMVPRNDTIIDGNHLVISKQFDLFSSYHCQYDFIYTTTIISIEMFWTSEQKETRLSLDPSKGSAHLVRDGLEEWTLPAGALPPALVEGERWTRFQVIVRPYERTMLVQVSCSEGSRSAFTVPVYLPDHFPIHEQSRCKFGLRMRTSDPQIVVSEYRADPIFPQIDLSRLFHLRPESFRVFELGWTVLQLRDSCGKLLGRPHGRIEVLLVRSTQDLSLKPWRPQPHQYEHGPLQYAKILHGLSKQYVNNPDAAIRASSIRFDTKSGTHLVGFMASCPGRYRLYIRYDGDCDVPLKVPYEKKAEGNWFLLPNHHIFIRP